jgi:hypothetical protein
MEIEFNPNSVGKPTPPQPAARPEVVRQTSQASPFEKLAAMQEKLKDVSMVRPEKVEHARALVAHVKYPPDDMLNSIASLLAMQISQSNQS